MKLRTWQSECISLALEKFRLTKLNHFLALATPGAGKTFMASALAEILHEQSEIDLVICLSPSTIVANDFKESLSTKFGACFSGKIGSLGQSLTYQHMQFLDTNFWALFERYRVFVIFDEIHHCRGSSVEDANSWGEQLFLNIKDKAKYSIALTGTPWRSDATPIALSQYCGVESKIECDYIYGLEEAIIDKVCRTPQIIAIDNDNISITENGKKKQFKSFIDLILKSSLSYTDIIENDKVIEHVISSANQKLNTLRLENPNAGGLIVAFSVVHAKQIQHIFNHRLNQQATVVTYREDDPMKQIKEYRNSDNKWIISVGMISEGTNIPRLQVCCHLTNIKTEMHFRQILGRILRITNSTNQEAIMYMPAEPNLVAFANRVGEDVPTNASIVKFEKMRVKLEGELDNSKPSETSLLQAELNDSPPQKESKDEKTFSLNISDTTTSTDVSPSDDEDKNPLTQSYEKMMDIFGRFKQETIEMSLFKTETVKNNAQHSKL